MAISEFANRGRILSYTTVWVARPGLAPPYTLGQIQLDDDGPLVFGHIRELGDGTRVPVPVRMVVADTDDAVPPFWFEPA
ncbi:OB-fold domain-containing protein [Blastococcus saxobsidens]|nr:OB-fold domain-containing protein [Blastococcus saxobsidens]